MLLPPLPLAEAEGLWEGEPVNVTLFGGLLAACSNSREWHVWGQLLRARWADHVKLCTGEVLLIDCVQTVL